MIKCCNFKCSNSDTLDRFNSDSFLLCKVMNYIIHQYNCTRLLESNILQFLHEFVQQSNEYELINYSFKETCKIVEDYQFDLK